MEIPVEMVLPPRAVAARGNTGGNKGEWAFFQADEALTAYVVDRLTKGDADRLDEQLDLILEDREYHQKRRALMSQVPWELVQTILETSREPVVVPDVPTIVVERVATARRLAYTIFRYIARHTMLRDTVTDRVPIFRPQPLPTHPAMDLNHMVPYPVRLALISQQIGEVCGRALMSERIVSSALADALVERWLHGLWSMLGLIVLEGMTDADKVGLPDRYRFDRDTISEEFVEQRNGFVAALAEVEANNKGYPQDYLSDDDDEEDE
jgi:hypothetical protein